MKILILALSLISCANTMKVQNLSYPPKSEIEKFERLDNKHKGGLIQFKVVKGDVKRTFANYKSAWSQARVNCGDLYVFAENDEWGDSKDKKNLMKKKYVNLEYRCYEAEK